MKNIFSILSILFISIVYGQSTPITTVNNIRITAPVEGTINDSLVVRRASDGVLRYYPISDLRDEFGESFVKKDPSPETSQDIEGGINVSGAVTTSDGVFVTKPAPTEANELTRTDYVNNIFYIKSFWKSPQDYGAITGDGIDDTVAFKNCLDNNLNIILYGDYDVDTSQLNIRDNHNIFSNNATIKNNDTSGNIFTASGVDNWTIGGVINFEGAGNASGTQRAIYINDCRGFFINNIRCTVLSGDPIVFDDAVPSGRGNRGLIMNLTALDNYGSVLFENRAEYHTIQNVNIQGSSTVGLKVLAGNVSVIGGSIVDNANGVLVGGGGTNNSHGILANLNINHNDITGGYNLRMDGVDEGHTVIGCHFYGNASRNIEIASNAKSVTFVGGIIDGRIDAAGTNTHLISSCQINSLTTLGGGNTNVICIGNINKDGGLWSGNTLDPNYIATTTDQTKTGMLTLVGGGPGTLKLKRGSFGATFANSSSVDDLALYDLSGSVAWQRWFPTGNVIIGSSIGTDNGYKLEVQGTFKSSGEATVAPATLSTSAPQLTQVQNLTGWAQYSGTNYTIGSPLVILAGNTTTLANNGAASTINTQLPTGVTSFVDTSNGKITPQNDGDFYVVDIRFKATSSSVDGVIDIGIDIGGAMGIIRQHTISLRKGIGVEQRVALSFPVFSGSTFVANGGEVKVSSIVGNTSIYDVTFVIDRTHKAKMGGWPLAVVVLSMAYTNVIRRKRLRKLENKAK